MIKWSSSIALSCLLCKSNKSRNQDSILFRLDIRYSSFVVKAPVFAMAAKIVTSRLEENLILRSKILLMFSSIRSRFFRIKTTFSLSVVSFVFIFEKDKLDSSGTVRTTFVFRLEAILFKLSFLRREVRFMASDTVNISNLIKSERGKNFLFAAVTIVFYFTTLRFLPTGVISVLDKYGSQVRTIVTERADAAR